ncbi:MAG: ribonuclease PH [Deltaproteobacteria bacterium]|nr:ribonuclease PH [Deltaproteobacteria bacterium]
MKRKSGRAFDELRSIKLTKNYLKHADGSVLVEWGHNIVVCSATIDSKVPPFLEGKKKGWITAEYAMLPTSTHQRSERERKKMGGRTYEIQRLIGRSLRSIIDLKQIGERTVILDCDVIQADGGTRCASITGAYVALRLALMNKSIDLKALKDSVAGVSVGIVDGQVLLDLEYVEDSNASVDMNVIATPNGHLIEVAATGEEATFTQEELDQMLKIALLGIAKVVEIQQLSF